MTARPYAYIRKSTKGVKESMPDQIANVRQIVARNGRPADLDDLVLLTADWGISAAREKIDKRHDMARLLAAIEAGEVSHVYAYSHDRLARDVQLAATLLNVLERAGISVTTGERTFNPADSNDRQQWHFTSMIGEADIERMQKKARDRAERDREKGTKRGQAPYGDRPGEDRALVLAAFDKAGSFNGAARILNDDKVPSRRGHLGMAWSAQTVGSIVRKARPDLALRSGGRGSRTMSTNVLSRLLVCPHDGTIMVAIHGKKRAAYICRKGHSETGHPRPFFVVESAIRPWVREQTEAYNRLVIQQAESPDEADLAAIAVERRQIGLALAKAAIDEATYDDLKAELDVRERNVALGRRAAWYVARGVDWTAGAAEVNAALRALWKGIVLAYVPATPVYGRHTSEWALAPVDVVPQPGVKTPGELRDLAHETDEAQS